MKNTIIAFVFAVLTLSLLPSATFAESLDDQIAGIQKQWAHAKYEIEGKDDKVAALHKVEEQAQILVVTYPNNPEPKIWLATALSTEAGIVRGLGVLGKLKEAKSLLEQAITQNPRALDGQAHVILGAMYFQVPGWPIAFGDNDKAKEHLDKAVALNPNGVDGNFFYGEFLRETGHHAEAKDYYEKAINAPARTGQDVADKGRKGEARKALDALELQPKKSKYN